MYGLKYESNYTLDRLTKTRERMTWRRSWIPGRSRWGTRTCRSPGTARRWLPCRNISWITQTARWKTQTSGTKGRFLNKGLAGQALHGRQPNLKNDIIEKDMYRDKLCWHQNISWITRTARWKTWTLEPMVGFLTKVWPVSGLPWQNSKQWHEYVDWFENAGSE